MNTQSEHFGLSRSESQERNSDYSAKHPDLYRQNAGSFSRDPAEN